MAYMTNREFAEHEYKRQKQNAYADALVEETRRLREENARLKAALEIVQRREKAAVCMICAGGCLRNYADPLPHCDGCTFRERS